MNVHNEIAGMRYRLDQLESEALEDQVDTSDTSEEVQEAAKRLAIAIAKSQGVDVDAMGVFAGSSQLLKLPKEFMEFGGIGIGVIMAEPQEEAGY